MAFKVVYTDYYYESVELEFELIRQEIPDAEIVDLTKLRDGGIKESDELVSHVTGANALVTQFARIDSAVMDAMPECRVISRHAIGLDTIDLEAAKERGILVANVPDYCIEEVSDTALAHILNGVRRVSEANALLRTGRWSYSAISPLKRLSEMTVGLLAFGSIARRLSEKLRPLRCTVLAHDVATIPEEEYPWVEFVGMDELLANADVISIHAPLSSQTRHLIDADMITKMKHGVVLVNTSRGGVIDQSALTRALRNGAVRFAGLDVLEEAETEYSESEILSIGERVAVTPHLGWYSEQSVQELKTKTARNVIETYVTGQPLYRVV